MGYRILMASLGQSRTQALQCQHSSGYLTFISLSSSSYLRTFSGHISAQVRQRTHFFLSMIGGILITPHRFYSVLLSVFPIYPEKRSQSTNKRDNVFIRHIKAAGSCRNLYLSHSITALLLSVCRKSKTTLSRRFIGIFRLKSLDFARRRRWLFIVLETTLSRIYEKSDTQNCFRVSGFILIFTRYIG